MPAVAAVGIHDDFSAGEPGIAHRPANDEAAGGIDVELSARIEQRRRYDVLNHFFEDAVVDFAIGYGVAVLRGDHHAIDARGLTIDIFDRHLRFAVGAQEWEMSRLANIGQAPHQLMREHNGQRHQFVSFIAGITEHQALVAGAASIHAHGDIGRLAFHR